MDEVNAARFRFFPVLREAINRGDSWAMATYADYHRRGVVGLKKNYSEALRLYLEAGDAGESGLGSMYLLGEGTDPSYPDALRLLKRGCERRDYRSLNNMGFMYETGRGVTKNHNEAARHYGEAIKRIGANAPHFLAWTHEHGLGEVALTLYKDVERSETPALYNMANSYFEGLGVSKNEAEAVSCLRKAVGMGSPQATYALALCYMNGRGVSRSKQEALHLLDRAAASAPKEEFPQPHELLKRLKYEGWTMSVLEELVGRGAKAAFRALVD